MPLDYGMFQEGIAVPMYFEQQTFQTVMPASRCRASCCAPVLFHPTIHDNVQIKKEKLAMKALVYFLLFIFCLSFSYAQLPQNITTARWIFPGNPRIMGLTPTADHKAPKQVWFTEKDSQYVGTLVFPRICGPASATEYIIRPINPYRIAYAEKVFTVSDNAVRPAKAVKHKPAVWFNRFTMGLLGGTYSVTGDTLYGLEPAAKKSTTGYLMAYPTLSQTMHAGTPQTVQWTPSVKINKITKPACLWFNGFYLPPGSQYPSLKIYSLEPQAKGLSPYEATLTEDSYPATYDLAVAFHVENGCVWYLHLDIQSSAMYLYMMPVTGGTGYRWPLGIGVTFSPAIIEPMYKAGKPKPGVLPNQVWINFFSSVMVLSLNPSSTGPDTMCSYSVPANSFIMGMYSDNAQKANPAKYMNAANLSLNNQTQAITSNVLFLRAAPASAVSREAVAYSTVTTKVNGLVRPVLTQTKTLAYSCGTSIAARATPSGCLTTEIDAPIGGAYIDLAGSPYPFNVDISGMADMKKFDLVSQQMGGPVLTGWTGSNEPAICRMKGTFAASPGNSPSTEPDFSFSDESQETGEAYEFALDDAYPNPFNPSTTIEFTLPEPTAVSLKVYNMLGEEVAVLIDGAVKSEGRQQVQFNASNLPSGVYFYRIQAGKFTAMKKIVLIK
jgi:hypothetical protein